MKNNSYVCEVFVKKLRFGDCVKIDAEQKFYRCNECGISIRDGFNQYLFLGEKFYLCREGGKGFSYGLVFLVYQYVYLGERCFSQSVYLQSYQRIYLEVKFYRCYDVDDCFSKSFFYFYQFYFAGEKVY